MISSSAFRQHYTEIKSLYDDEKTPGVLSRTLKMLKSCFGYGFEIDTPTKNKNQRTGDSAKGFEGEDVCGIKAEYLDEDDMAWGKPKKSRKQGRRRN